MSILLVIIVFDCMIFSIILLIEMIRLFYYVLLPSKLNVEVFQVTDHGDPMVKFSVVHLTTPGLVNFYYFKITHVN